VQSKANSAGAARKASALWQNSYDELDSQKTWAKQSQLPYVQGWARPNKGAGPASGTHCAKQSQFLMGEQEGAGTGKLVHAGAEQSVRNEANSPRAAQRASTLWKENYDRLDQQEALARQSQFTHGREGAGTGKATNAAGGANRAKQSQFASHRPARAPAGKTKPISGVRAMRWIWNPPPHAGHTRCDGVAASLFPSSMVASILGAHR
jgi:hypothetical protein